ncbi:hypothetical protein PORCRE_1780 [Porphyromonas crevioricanis JCM 15906]|uniref:Uncharacterized protein n=2 Tax=Porphyromonas crevioricanis TaxID=393921 RepID=A0A2X4SSR5_9PORP|nr:hypothetical protein PORCRE_1780 [Porphyromonas crevioricanis JCM 15906]GAD06989.1 hypothetical protein PORCAN_602 [Porphyromonas crevioricanis JCM 13913]SJZ62009.1 hypothetical protein SAMN02745203_00344 [Porphyromonas crevioricanis]SQH72851.1 Uncharacterised protein [Porphyromonas crevioricanis]
MLELNIQGMDLEISADLCAQLFLSERCLYGEGSPHSFVFEYSCRTLIKASYK